MSLIVANIYSKSNWKTAAVNWVLMPLYLRNVNHTSWWLNEIHTHFYMCACLHGYAYFFRITRSQRLAMRIALRSFVPPRRSCGIALRHIQPKKCCYHHAAIGRRRAQPIYETPWCHMPCKWKPSKIYLWAIYFTSIYPFCCTQQATEIHKKVFIAFQYIS